MDDSLLVPYFTEDSFILSYITVEPPFSNWTAHRIFIWGMHFATVEHAFQYRKFITSNPRWAFKIKNAKSPYEAQLLSRMRPIDRKKWNHLREKVMRELLCAKVKQHEDVRAALIASGTRAIIEKGSLRENYWGIGPDLNGRNTLGKLWVSIRSDLAGE
jgi:ribA/ribD-fused uncharacterized protein